MGASWPGNDAAYRGNKVWILVDEAGQATLDDARPRPAPLQARGRPDLHGPAGGGPPARREPRSGRRATGPPKPPIEVWIHAGRTDRRAAGSGSASCCAWRDRRRELTPAAATPRPDDEVLVGAVARRRSSAIRQPAWPVRIRIAAARRASRRSAPVRGTAPPACGEAPAPGGSQAFPDLELLLAPDARDARGGARRAAGARTAHAPLIGPFRVPVVRAPRTMRRRVPTAGGSLP